KKKKARSNRGLLIGAAVGGVLLIVVVVILLRYFALSGAAPRQKINEPAPMNPQQANAPPVGEQPQPDKKAPVGGLGRIREVTVVQNALRQLGLAYKHFEVEKNRGPKNQQELSPYYENNGEINEALTKKWLTFIWGASRQSLAEHGDSNTILAYETDLD